MRRYWTEKSIRECKSQVKDQLDQELERSGPGARLRTALTQVQKLEDDLSNDGLLKRYVFAFSALFHHVRHSGLSDSQITMLLKLLDSTLEYMQIDPNRSKCKFLYSELNFLKSQLARIRGHHWDSAWNIFMIEESPDQPWSNADRRSLAAGIRLMRLGLGTDALQAFLGCVDELTNPADQFLASLNIGILYRYAGEYKLSQEVHEKLSRTELSDHQRLDLEFEILITGLLQDGDPAKFVSAIKRGKPHSDQIYWFEGFLWTSLLPQRWQQMLAKVSTVARREKVSRLDPLYKVADCVERCRNTEIPMRFRLQECGQVIAERQHLRSVQQELLSLAAFAKWLIGVHAFPQAQLVLREYEALSLRLSGGASSDALGVIEPVLEKYLVA